MGLGVALVSIIACASSTYDDDGGAPDRRAMRRDGGASDAGIDSGPPGRPCGSTRCELFARCVDGECRPFRTCIGSGECEAGELCRHRYCVPADYDVDGDGSVAGEDCDETAPTTYPGAPELCDLVDQDCDESTDEALARVCSTACGDGTETCVAGAFSGCTAPAPEDETCDGADEDCDGSTDEMLSRACSTACGTGEERCTAGSFGGCTAPVPSAESCNVTDDDCDGSCDEGAGCRTAIHRSVHPVSGEHFYTSSASEAACCGFTVEHYDFYFVYTSSVPGLVPFYRCVLASGFHFYTTSAACEGAPGSVLEGTLGYVATGASVCGSIPLYRLVSGNDHFFTTSAPERDYAISVGYVDEGIGAYVFGGG
jgi:hypothetical protein